MKYKKKEQKRMSDLEKFFPIASCDDIYFPEYKVTYCIIEKVILAIDVIAIFVLIWQIKIQGDNISKYKSFKMSIYYTCLTSALYVFVLYAILSRYL